MLDIHRKDVKWTFFFLPSTSFLKGFKEYKARKIEISDVCEQVLMLFWVLYTMFKD
jgi:hypothetical protein